jgi:hypothetical protein
MMQAQLFSIGRSLFSDVVHDNDDRTGAIYELFLEREKKFYMGNVVNILRYMILLMYWIFYLPFFEVF